MTAAERYKDPFLWWFDWCHLWLSIGLLRAVDCDDEDFDETTKP